MAKDGEAYGFMYCSATTQQIITELADAREITQAPSMLGIDLVAQVDQIDTSGDSALADIVQRAKAEKMSHVIKASMPNAGNRRVAGLLGNIIDGLYASPLYPAGAPYCAGVVYKKGAEYVFKRD
ncbi:MAG TPA: hypothetical protein HA362_07650 [Nanoarchaeota archaeon]|nr:hypothetical protein [Nanoarchaeota archaeon]